MDPSALSCLPHCFLLFSLLSQSCFIAKTLFMTLLHKNLILEYYQIPSYLSKIADFTFVHLHMLFFLCQEYPVPSSPSSPTSSITFSRKLSHTTTIPQLIWVCLRVAVALILQVTACPRVRCSVLLDEIASFCSVLCQVSTRRFMLALLLKILFLA